MDDDEIEWICDDAVPSTTTQQINGLSKEADRVKDAILESAQEITDQGSQTPMNSMASCLNSGAPDVSRTDTENLVNQAVYFAGLDRESAPSPLSFQNSIREDGRDENRESTPSGVANIPRDDTGDTTPTTPKDFTADKEEVNKNQIREDEIPVEHYEVSDKGRPAEDVAVSVEKEPELPYWAPREEVPVTVVNGNEEGKTETAEVKQTPNEATTSGMEQKKTDGKQDDSYSFDIDEYERRMSEKTTEMKALVDRLFEKSDAVASNNGELAKRAADIAHQAPPQRRVSFEPTTFGPISGGLPSNVESVVVGKGHVKEVSGVAILPNGNILATDTQLGILVFSIDGELVQHVQNPDWKKPAAPCVQRNYILLIQSVKQDDGQFSRMICKFSLTLELIAKIECPMWIREREPAIISERLTVSAIENIYLAVNADTFSGIYELSPLGIWTEIDYKLDERYSDIIAFSIIPPITQLLAIESRRNYVVMLSIRESRLAEKRKMGVVERPGALAMDEAGHVFVLNRATASILSVDTISWCGSKAVCVVESMISHFSASRGLLAVPLKDSIRVQKYEFR